MSPLLATVVVTFLEATGVPAASEAVSWSAWAIQRLAWLIREYSPYAGYIAIAMVWAGIAQGKGRSGLFWFFAALLLPGLSWLLLLLLPARD